VSAPAPDPSLAPSPGRLKRQVQGRAHRFAIVCPPGFEDVCLDEARALGLSLCPGPDGAAAVPGPVVEFEGKLEELNRACLFLRVASRVLVRLGAFRAGAREELFRRATDFPWELWLPGGGELRVDAHVRHSRISHEGMTADTVFEAVCRRLRLAGLEPPARAGAAPAGDSGDEAETGEGAAESAPAGAPRRQRLIVHLEDNHAQLSLDASGDHLHRRGWRLVQGPAPIRENLAAGLLAWAGWPARHGALVDGMCGSGTLAIEALSASLGGPAGGRAVRRHAFADWPSFQPARFEWLARQVLPAAAGHPESAPPPILANELDPAVLALAQQNAACFAGAIAGVSWRQGDFFDLVPPPPANGRRGLLVLNPPYGLRLSDGEGRLYPRLCRRLAEAWGAWDILLLGLPDTPLGPLAARVSDRRGFRHGGLRLMAWLVRGQS
jgi:23S rRNA G2445 N2-methylase RlmL